MALTPKHLPRSLTRLALCTLTWAIAGVAPVWAQTAEDSAATTMIVDAKPAPQLPLPATNMRAYDAPLDGGHAIDVEWTASADDGQGRSNVVMYRILRTPSLRGPFNVDSVPSGDPSYRVYDSRAYGTAAWKLTESEWDTLGEVPMGTTSYENRGGKRRVSSDFFPDQTEFQYKVLTVNDAGGISESETSAPATSYGQYFHTDKLLHIGIPALVFMLLVLYFIRVAQSGKELYIRPLGGINAVDEAIGRATEMNRPILYVLGLGAADEIATIASLTILARVTKKVAEHRTELLVPCYDAVVMSIAQETVKQAYLDAGRPDEYKEDIVYFVTQEQFAYVAAVNGTMLRRQTATNFYLGVFYAESLILAETGSIAGSIQISGTDRTTQIPFFVVACDYTLIGEELFAASAYLSREPKLLGTLKAQDYAKAIFLAVMIGGCIGAALQWQWIANAFHLTF